VPLTANVLDCAPVVVGVKVKVLVVVGVRVFKSVEAVLSTLNGAVAVPIGPALKSIVVVPDGVLAFRAIVMSAVEELPTSVNPVVDEKSCPTPMVVDPPSVPNTPFTE